MRAALRLLLLAVMLLAPMGRIGMAEAMAAHCADVPAAAASHHGGHHQPAPAEDKSGTAIDCMIACAAMAPAPAPSVAPAPRATPRPAAPLPASLTGIRPDAATPPPRHA
ncbi:MAG TPA: hypothetical protein VMG08_09985 [Allosphingosinicella sp.]|nr:hypothetical protein [Allosphingosinicella sp.]